MFDGLLICIILLDQAYPTFGMVSGDKIYVFWDQVNRVIVVQWNKASDNSFTTITDGPVIPEVVPNNLIQNVYPQSLGFISS